MLNALCDMCSYLSMYTKVTLYNFWFRPMILILFLWVKIHYWTLFLFHRRAVFFFNSTSRLYKFDNCFSKQTILQYKNYCYSQTLYLLCHMCKNHRYVWCTALNVWCLKWFRKVFTQIFMHRNVFLTNLKFAYHMLFKQPC